MHGGAKEFCENVRYNAIKRFFKKKKEKISLKISIKWFKFLE